MARKTYRKTITITISPTVILLAVLILCIGWTLIRLKRNPDPKTLRIAETAVLVEQVKTLGELTTACYYDELVLQGTKQNYFSTTPLGALAREGLGRDVDDHLVLIARGTVRAGLDFLEMDAEDIRFSGDTVYLRLPEPRYLDVIVNPSDFEVFAESGTWTHEQVSRLQDTAGPTKVPWMPSRPCSKLPGIPTSASTTGLPISSCLRSGTEPGPYGRPASKSTMQEVRRAVEWVQISL